MELIIGIVIGLVILMLLVVAHEFGHFIMARRNGVKVNEFGIGFPPRLAAWVKKDGKWQKIPRGEWDKKRDSLVFSINWLPIGGFCSMDGESDADTRKGTFGAASFKAKTKILFGGVVMNWLVAFVLLTIVSFVGMPQFLDHQFYLGQDAKKVSNGVTISHVEEGSPAAEAGFAVGDRVLKVGDQTVEFASDVTSYGDAWAGKEATYIVERNGEEKTLSAKLNPSDAKYVLGVGMASQTFIRSTWSAPIVGLGTTIQLTGETFRGLGEMVWNLCSGVVRQFSPNDEVREAGRSDIGQVSDSVSGPVGIIGVIFPAFASTGFSNLAFLAALISVSLACMNILPIPALDGGRWLLIAIYRLRHKKLTKETEERVVSRAFMVLMALIVLITILDIVRLF